VDIIGLTPHTEQPLKVGLADWPLSTRQVDRLPGGSDARRDAQVNRAFVPDDNHLNEHDSNRNAL